MGNISIPLDCVAQAFFDVSITVDVWDGTRALFWVENLITDYSVETLAPNFGRLSHWGLNGRGYYSCQIVQVNVEFLFVWDLVQIVMLTSEPYRFSWKCSPNGQYSSTSIYFALFLGHIGILGAWQIVQIPGKFQFFAWLVTAGHPTCFIVMVYEIQMSVHCAHNRLRLRITFSLTMSSAERCGSEPLGISLYRISPWMTPIPHYLVVLG